MKGVKKLFLVLLVGLVFFSFSDDIYALVYTSDANNTRVCYNRSNGDYGGSHAKGTASCASGYGTDSIKLINNKNAYCVEWSLRICSKNYAVDAGWNKNSVLAITAGMIMDHMENTISDAHQRYEMVAAVMNTYFNRNLGNSASYNYYSTNQHIRNVMDTIINGHVPHLRLGTSIPSPNFTMTGSVMGKVNNYYMSNKITLDGLYSRYGGTNTYGGAPVTYVLKATTTGGKAQICTSPLGENCMDSKTIQPTTNTEKFSFYVKVSSSDGTTEVVPGSSVTINVSASNTSTYPTIVKYYNTDCGDSQDLITKDSSVVNRTGGMSVRLMVPDTVNHRISVLKVDEYGGALQGASLAIYKDDITVASNLLKENINGAAEISYVSPKVSENSDDFFKHNYYLVEKSAPDGYVKPNNVTMIFDKELGESNTSICYFSGEDDSSESKVVDSERCNFDNYIYMCKPSVGSELKAVNADGNCAIVPPISGDTDTDGSDSDASEDNDDTSEGDSTGETEENVPVEEVITYEKVCYNKKEGKVIDDITYCTDKANYIKVEQTSGNFVVTQPNTKNLIRISKQSITSDEEVVGATLKICTASDYKKEKIACTPAKTVKDVEMIWESGYQPHDIYGIKKGDYYIVETTVPNGYVSANIATAFSIDEFGTVKTGDRVITNKDFIQQNDMIVIENELSLITISKQDMATSKELSGATLSICRTYLDENNEYQLITDQYDDECIVASLESGELATWVSTNEPKEIRGLPAGTYYLVEKIAPTDYSTAESILFTLKNDGTLVDKDGNSLADNKLIMHDKKIEEVKTGSFSTYVVIGTLIVVMGLGIGSYYYLKKVRVVPMNVSDINNIKIRKRKIHKK